MRKAYIRTRSVLDHSDIAGSSVKKTLYRVRNNGSYATPQGRNLHRFAIDQPKFYDNLDYSDVNTKAYDI